MDAAVDPSSAGLALSGRTIAVTAERRSSDQIDLFTKRGATVIHAPTMHTLDLTDDAALRAVTDLVIADPPEWTIATTGFGMRLWFETAASWGLEDRLLAAIGTSNVVARGPKAQSACRQRDLEVVWRAADESMDEVVEWMRERSGLENERIAVQLFDPEEHPSTVELRALSAEVLEIPVYRWSLPLDTGPAVALVERIVDRSVDAVTFTSQPAVRFLLEIAAEEDRGPAVVEAFNDGSVLPVCIGPVNAVALVEAGVTTAIWPEPYRLVPMVKLAEATLARS